MPEGILAENRLPHLYATLPLGGPRRNIATTYGMEKLEWFGYQTVKKIWRYVYSFGQFTNVKDRLTDERTDRRKDRHRKTAYRPRLHSIARQKWKKTPAFIYVSMTTGDTEFAVCVYVCRSARRSGTHLFRNFWTGLAEILPRDGGLPRTLRLAFWWKSPQGSRQGSRKCGFLKARL